MKRILIALAASTVLTTSAWAETIGVSMALFDDNFLTVLRNGMDEYAKTLDGVEVQIEDAGNDVAKQLDQIKNFIASGVDAKGFNVGAYAGIGAAVGPYAMVAVKHDWVDLDVHSPTFAVPNINAVNTGADVELGWRGSLVALSFDVNAGLSVVRTRIDDFAIAGTDFQFGGSTSTRGRLGGRATFNGPFRPFAEARLFHEFGEPGGLRVISGDAEDKLDIAGRGSWARIEAGVGGGNDRALLSAWADLGDREGWGLRAGFKF